MNTNEFILAKVAPIFNKQGYVGTSLADITQATGLTKGAIYCNFANKEDLAQKAFELNVRTAIYPLFRLIATTQGAIHKLYAITTYQRGYYHLVKDLGGCPMLRVGVDTKYINPLLFKQAENLSKRMLDGLATIIEEGKLSQELKQDINPLDYAKVILSMIEGSSLLAFTHNDESYISKAMDFIDNGIIAKIKN
ncbi:TetR/AcrR family transcriptional regulator [Pedobacter sp. KR3-3]|uniref:TetR/AcrR family transcriptional regulator n=1 Tax=Pedobacter albus TaxID=3113905 RepID=A0ABU7I427_9SPHI|nr:TetR/AcrR family transcriptional regulator [Pedobacter sp. KR3-3]MEE1944221.1 TetR/AcrR family transcriptional regulator [Pedobacter sp. KR3-3]